MPPGPDPSRCCARLRSYWGSGSRWGWCRRRPQPQAPVGNDFVVTTGRPVLHPQADQDLRAAHHDADRVEPVRHAPGTARRRDPGRRQVPDYLTAYGLRTVDGSCNNLKSPATARFAASDEVFPRLTNPSFRDADSVPPTSPSFSTGQCTDPVVCNTSYKQTSGNVVDSQPRTISNLIVDQTSNNPAAVAAAHPAGTCPGHGAPAPSPAPDVGHPVVYADATPLTSRAAPRSTTRCSSRTSPPTSASRRRSTASSRSSASSSTTASTRPSRPVTLSSSRLRRTTRCAPWARTASPATVTKSPLPGASWSSPAPRSRPGPDGVLGTADDGPDNTDTPWVDQSQTYTSHASHQVFLREYAPGTGHRASTTPRPWPPASSSPGSRPARPTPALRT